MSQIESGEDKPRDQMMAGGCGHGGTVRSIGTTGSHRDSK